MRTTIALLLVFASIGCMAQDIKPAAYQKQRGSSCGAPLRPLATTYVIDDIQALPLPVMAVPIPQYPVVSADNPSSHVFTREQLNRMPWTSIRDVASTVPGVYQQRRGDEISVFGSRTSGNSYIVDGMK